MMLDFTKSNPLAPYKLVLGSASPRRQELLQQMGFSFEVRIANVDENYPQHLCHHEITDYIATQKAQALRKTIKENELLLTADTLVWHREKALGKPKSSEEAKEMLCQLSGKTHEVITSICLLNKQHMLCEHDTTQVTFNTLRDRDIDHYIEKFRPLDKAGSYGIQEWIGLIGVEKIEGNYQNVVGLPTTLVYKMIKNLSST